MPEATEPQLTEAQVAAERETIALRKGLECEVAGESPAAMPTPVEQEQCSCICHGLIAHCQRCSGQPCRAIPHQLKEVVERVFPNSWGSLAIKELLDGLSPFIRAPSPSVREAAKEGDVVYPCTVDIKTLFACLQTAEQVFRKPDEPARLERFRRTKAKLIAQANASYRSTVSAAGGDEDRLRWLLTRIIHDLPARHDWLDPDLEREVRTYMK